MDGMVHKVVEEGEGAGDDTGTIARSRWNKMSAKDDIQTNLHSVNCLGTIRL